MSLTSKQRALLRSLANSVEPVFQVGKGDIGENQVKGLEEAINKRELIKITVLKNSPMDAKNAADVIAQKLNAEVVAVTGSKIVIYRRSQDKTVKHIEI